MRTNRRPTPRCPSAAGGLELALKRLVERGVPADDALAWLEAWDATTASLVDFRRAPDFWQVGYEYALAEYRLGFGPPALTVASPSMDLAVPEKRARMR